MFTLLYPQLQSTRTLSAQNKCDWLRSCDPSIWLGSILRWKMQEKELGVPNHVMERSNSRWTVQVTEWLPRDGTKSRGRPITWWQDEIWKFDGKEYIAKLQLGYVPGMPWWRTGGLQTNLEQQWTFIVHKHPVATTSLLPQIHLPVSLKQLSWLLKRVSAYQWNTNSLG